MQASRHEDSLFDYVNWGAIYSSLHKTKRVHDYLVPAYQFVVFIDVCQFDYFLGRFMHCDLKCFCMNKALLLEFALEVDPRNDVFNL